MQDKGTGGQGDRHREGEKAQSPKYLEEELEEERRGAQRRCPQQETRAQVRMKKRETHTYTHTDIQRQTVFRQQEEHTHTLLEETQRVRKCTYTQRGTVLVASESQRCTQIHLPWNKTHATIQL